MSAAALARRAGISPTRLSEIENGKKEGSLKTLRAIARAPAVNLDELVPWDDGDAEQNPGRGD